MAEPQSRPTPNGWQFALSVLNEWHKTIAILVVIMFLGWPAMVIKNWGQDMGYWQSMAGIEQDNREHEHRAQTAVLRDLSLGLEKINDSLSAYSVQASRKDGIIVYLLSENCDTKDVTPFQKARCLRLQRSVSANER